jgi:N-acetylmuramoyl-L-alanine amidase
MEKDKPLVANKTYLLPIFIYPYNRESISSTIGIEDWMLAKKILDYNTLIAKEKLIPSGFMETNVLWVPYHEFECPAIVVARTEEETRPFPLLGEKYKDVVIESDNLKGKVYYLVAGHGGPDPGALSKIGKKRICEDEYAYDVTLRLARNLYANGAKVYVIIRDQNDGIRDGEILNCDNDEKCWYKKSIPANQIKRLEQRSNIINQLHSENLQKGYSYQRMIVIHCDSRNEGQKVDMYFYHYPESSNGQQFATRLRDKVRQKYNEHQSGRGYGGTVTPRNLFMLRETKLVGTYIELGNMRNSYDQKRLIIENNRQAIANWLYQGLLTAI